MENARQLATLSRYLMFVGMAALYDTLTTELRALLPTSDPEETKVIVFRREKQSNTVSVSWGI